MTKFDLDNRRVWVAGHRGMAGAAIMRRLEQEQCELFTATRSELDLQQKQDVEAWMGDHKIEVVFHAAATVGGILANSVRPAEFLYDNLMVEANVIHGAWHTGVKKLLFLGSSCIYPRLAPQPMKEESLLTGELEPTNQWYAIAKIAGIKMCQAYRRQYGCNFISLMPTNLYGPGDRYDLQSGHVVAALIMKIHAARMMNAPTVELWGTGSSRREFLFTEDLADGCVFAIKHYAEEQSLNIGTGIDMTILELATLLAVVIGWQGEFVFDLSKPDGPPRKVMDVSRLREMGWVAPTSLEVGMKKAYEWFLENVAAHKSLPSGERRADLPSENNARR